MAGVCDDSEADSGVSDDSEDDEGSMSAVGDRSPSRIPHENQCSAVAEQSSSSTDEDQRSAVGDPSCSKET